MRQVGELGHWAIGAHAFMVGSSFLQSRNLLAIVHPILRNLMEESGETVNMAVLDQSDHESDYYRPGTVYASDANVRAYRR